MKKNYKYALMLLIVAFSLSSCAKKMMFMSSPVVPAAKGNVKVTKDNNNNYEVEVNVKNLAESKRLTPPKDTYVVWIETETAGTKNIGQIKSSNGMLSSAMKASLKAVTSFRPRSVFITAEDDGNIQYPGNTMILRTESFSVK